MRRQNVIGRWQHPTRRGVAALTLSESAYIRPMSLHAAIPSLGADEVHVWRLTYDHQQRRRPLTALLARYLEVEHDQVALSDGEHGRPRLADGLDPSLDFNWSHSGNQAVIALARGVAPGVDIERRRERERLLAIAQRFFSADEAAALAALPAADRDTAFLRLWTAKEAILKAIGRGIAFGLKRLDVVIENGEPRLRRLHGDDPAAWQLRALMFEPSLLGALAWRGDARRVLLFELDPARR